MDAATAAQNQADVNHLQTLLGTFPSSHVVLVDSEQHNVMGYLHNAGLLRLFCACRFEYWDNDKRAELLTLLNSTARYISEVQAPKAEGMTAPRNKLFDSQKAARAERQRHGAELKTIYPSTTWRLTKPLRNLVDNIKRLRRGRFAGR